MKQVTDERVGTKRLEEITGGSISQMNTHNQQLLVTESPILHSSRRASIRVLTVSPGPGALTWPSHLPCQTLALHLSPDSLSLLPNLPGSGILHGDKQGKRRKQTVI